MLLGVRWLTFECCKKGYCKLIAIIIYKLDAISILYGYLIFPLHPKEKKKQQIAYALFPL